MTKDNQERLNRMHVLLDILVTVMTYALAWFIVVSREVLPLDEGVLKPQVYFMALIFIVPTYLILCANFRLYAPKRIQGRRSELANICKANVIGLMLFTFVLSGLRRFVNHLDYFSTKMTLTFFTTNIVLLKAGWISIRILLRSLRTNGYNQKHVLLTGHSRAAEGFIDRVSVSPEWRYHVQRILDDHRPVGFTYKKIQILESTNHLGDFLVSNTLDEIAIAPSIKEYSNLEQIVAACGESGVHTKLMPDYNSIIPIIPYVEDLQGPPVICIRHAPLTGVFNATMKRIADLAGALFGSVVFSPLMLVTALLIKVTSLGPMFFSQERVGLHNCPFKMYKFRSMEVQDPSRERSRRTVPHNPGVTPVGRFIYKASTSEMPQSFNILVGNMSLVGPRSGRPLFVERSKEEIPRYMIKHQVRSGPTGWAQVNGYRGNTSITRRTEHDLYHIEDWSLGSDPKIMFLTVFKGFISKNAY